MVTRIYARDCVIREISADEADFFISKYHKQGNPKKYSNPYRIGLFHKTDQECLDILGVAVFSTPRTRAMFEKYRFELLRMCFKGDYRIVGGSSKLIKAFICDKNPTDFFTYQDTSGETTDVYEKSGMTLVSEAKPKKVLVKDGLSYNEAQNNRSDWFSMEQVVRFGPDALLKTNLGEVFDQDSGKRLSNIELFTEKMGYHIEEIPGDRIYEWYSPNAWFYTYRITASDSPKYYYGRRTLWTDGPEPSEDDLLNDGYFGSGGTKYKNWIKRHEDFLEKEILGVYSKWGKSVLEEKKLIGDLYKTDKNNCLNSIPGGQGLAGSGPKLNGYRKDCKKHGRSLHRNGSCVECGKSKPSGFISFIECDTHGSIEAPYALKVKCPKCFPNDRGTDKGSGGRRTTRDGSGYPIKKCKVHGETKHHGATCLKCAIGKSIGSQYCIIHGEGPHKAGTCIACQNLKRMSFSKGSCKVHGEATLIDEKCFQCVMDNNLTFGELIEYGRLGEQHHICPCCKEVIPKATNSDIVFSAWKQLDGQLRLPGNWTSAICSSCRKLDKFWSNPFISYITDNLYPELMSVEPRHTRIKDQRLYDMKCVHCGTSKEFSSARLVWRKGRFCGCPVNIEFIDKISAL